MLTNYFLIVMLTIISSTISAIPSTATSIKFWKDAEVLPKEIGQSNRVLFARPDSPPLRFRALELNEIGFRDRLFTQDALLNARSVESSQLSPSTITIPLPEGGEISLNIKEISVMAPELAQKFPHVKTWKVTGIDQHIHGRIDFTSQGFHAMLIMPDGDTVFIEPDREKRTSDQLLNQGSYLSFSKRTNKDSFKNDFKCGVHSDSKVVNKTLTTAKKAQARSASDLITYRLAVATTGEYTQFHGSKENAFDAVVTTINRVNEIYERDLGIRLELIAEEFDLIYPDPNTDPYTNNNANTLLEQNIQNLSSSGVLGATKFDIGHVFGAGNVGGLAFVGSTCDSLFKAGGTTGISSPIGDAFALDYVAHEIGHQMGATHTFNSFCGGGQRSPDTAVEPGSGSTIMSYAGICQGNNLQFNVDPQFHAASIDQMMNFSRSEGGSVCGIRQAVSNQNPVVDAGPDFVVPARTPLVLIANGSDSDGDILSYTWEQLDTGTASDVDVDTGDNAIFRSRPPNLSKTRYIPRLTDLFVGSAVAGERVPVTSRNVKFVATIRDGEGGIQMDQVDMQVFDTGSSFRVTSHISNQTLTAEDTATLQWDVAGTDVSPISCQSVSIGLITSNGNGVVIETTDNDGQQQIIIPSNVPAMENARFIIACSNSQFFNVSSAALTILNSIVTGGGSGNDGGGGSLGFLIFPLFTVILLRRKTNVFQAIN